MIYQSQVADTLARAFDDYYTKQITGMIDERIKLVDFYNGNHPEYIGKFIDIDADDIPISFTNITKSIINKISQVYQTGPSRDCASGEDKYNELTVQKDFWMKEIERRTNLLGVVAVRPILKNGEFTYQIIQNFLPLFDPGDTLNPVGITYPINNEGRDNQLWAYWDENEHYIVNARGERIKNQSDYGVNEEMINPLGILPFVFCHSSAVVNDFWTPTAYDIVDANEKIDLDLSSLNYELRYQSFKQLYATGINDSTAIKLGYNNVPVLPEGATLNSLDMQPRFNETVGSIKFQLQMIERNYGLNINWGMEGSPSGFSLVVQNIDLLRSWRDDIEISRMWERDLFEVEKAVAGFEGISFDGLTVNFAEPSLPVNKQEEMAYWQFLVDKGLKNWADYYVEVLDPETTYDDAKKIIENNLSMKATATRLETPPTALDRLLG